MFEKKSMSGSFIMMHNLPRASRIQSSSAEIGFSWRAIVAVSGEDSSKASALYSKVCRPLHASVQRHSPGARFTPGQLRTPSNGHLARSKNLSSQLTNDPTTNDKNISGQRRMRILAWLRPEPPVEESWGRGTWRRSSPEDRGLAATQKGHRRLKSQWRSRHFIQ